jgi:hypothetical protein
MLSAYAPPRADLESHSASEDAERRQLLRHERSLRAIGVLHVIGAVLGVCTLIAIAFDGLPGSAVLLLGALGVCALHAWVGVGLARLDRRVRHAAGLLHGVGLLAFPVGTAVNAYVLYLLFGAKGKRILSPEYRALIERTPGVRLPFPVLRVLLVAIGLAGTLALLLAR